MGPNQLPVWPVCLQFVNSQMETGFVSARKPVLARRTLWLLFFLVMAVTGVVLLSLIWKSSESGDVLGELSSLSFLVQAGSLGLILLLSVFTSAVLSNKRSLGKMTPVQVEGLLISSITLCMYVAVVAVGTSPARVARLQGQKDGAGEASVYDTDTTMLLTIDVFVMATHLGLPIRWYVMAPLEVAAVGLYASIIGVVGMEEQAVPTMLQNMLLQICLVAAAAFGKRALELDERSAFLSMIDEKALRCEAEYQLSLRVLRPGDASPPLLARGTSREGQFSRCGSSLNDGVMSVIPSEITTAKSTKSNRVFEGLFESNVNTTEQLNLVASMGDTEHWRIKASEVGLLPEDALGAGGYGTIQRAVFCGMLVAVKCPKVELGTMRVSDLCNELRVLRYLRHPNIVTAHGAVILPEQKKIFLVLELIDGVRLTEFLLRKGAHEIVTDTARYQIMLGVCRALLYMHTRVPKIVHGDLKGSNIMVEASSRGVAHPKVLDFGLSRVLASDPRALGGTLRWIAPEVMDRSPVCCSADIYSLGLVLAFTATSILPMRGMNLKSILWALQRRRRPLPSWPGDNPFAPTCKPLVTGCLLTNPEKRPTIVQINKILLDLPAELGLEDPENGFLQQTNVVAKQSEKTVAVDLLEPSADGVAKNLSMVPEEEAVSSNEESKSTHAKAAAKAARRLPFPDLPETGQGAMEATLIAAFQRWNKAYPNKFCCERHVWFRIGEEVCAKALASGCVVGPIHKCACPTQCANCGVLGIKDTCEFCGWDIADYFSDASPSAMMSSEQMESERAVSPPPAPRMVVTRPETVHF